MIFVMNIYFRMIILDFKIKLVNQYLNKKTINIFIFFV